MTSQQATHSSVLAWRIPGTGEPGGLPSMGSHRVGHDRSDLAAAAAVTQVKSDHLFNVAAAASFYVVSDFAISSRVDDKCQQVFCSVHTFTKLS